MFAFPHKSTRSLYGVRGEIKLGRILTHKGKGIQDAEGVQDIVSKITHKLDHWGQKKGGGWLLSPRKTTSLPGNGLIICTWYFIA